MGTVLPASTNFSKLRRHAEGTLRTGAGEPDHVDEDACNVGRICTVEKILSVRGVKSNGG